MPHQTLAAVSNHLFASAVIVYVLGMLAYAAQFASSRARQPATEAGSSLVPARPVPTPAVNERVLVAPGGSVIGPPPDRVGVPLADAIIDREPTAPGPGRAARAGRVALALTVLGWSLHLLEVITRGFAAGRVPWGNMYEFSSAVGLIAVSVFLVLQARQPRVRELGVFVMLPVVCYLGLAGTVLYVKAGPLVPALDSYWIKIHVVAAITATGTFMIGGVVSCLHLLRRRGDAALAAGRGPRLAALTRRLPSAASLDRTEYRVIAFAFPIWTFAIIAGAIWAESAWGRYWGWDPKETWSFITWVIYAAYLHTRSTRAWRRAAPGVALLGFSALMVNYYVVNIFITGLHSYAGV